MIAFINASQNQDGNTARMANKFIDGPYEQINLADYKIYQLGQHYDDDQFDQVLAKIRPADTIILGTPVYWHSMSAYLKTLLERLSQQEHPEMLKGKTLSVFVQGADPSDTIEPTQRLVKRFATVMGMKYKQIQ